MEHSEGTGDLDEVVARLRQTVEERRRAGVYPPALEDELAAHFRRVAEHRVEEPDLTELRRALDVLESLPQITSERIATESGLPGGERLHRTMAKFQSRQIEGVLHQMREFSQGVTGVLRALGTVVQDPNSHIHTDLLDQLDAALDRLTSFERGAPGDAEPGVVADLRRRVERLESAEARRQFRPFFSRARLLDELPGAPLPAELVERLGANGPVFQMGAGRGDLLSALVANGADARGVEGDEELAALARARGLQVEVGEPLRVLSEQPDGSLGALALIDVAEHLSPQDLADAVALAADKVRAGGLVVCRTIDPASAAAVPSPTPVHPLSPLYLTFLFHAAGFATVEIDAPAPPAYALVACR